jgi:integrase/recombinase XerD
MQDKRVGRKAVRTRQTVLTKSNKKYTLEQAFEIFLHAKVTEGLRDRTIKDHKKHFEYLMKWMQEYYPDIKYVDDVTTHILREYVYYLSHEKPLYEGHPNKSEEDKAKTGLSSSTINIRITTLKTFFNWLYNEKIIPLNPAENIKKQRVEEDTIGAFTDEQVEALLSQVDTKTYAGYRDFVLMRLMLETGMRINEVLSLKKSNIDFTTRLITLNGSQNKNRRVRVIPISKEMVRLMLDLIAENQSYFPESEKIFLTNYGEPLTQITVSHRIKQYARKAGIADQVRCSPHTFRHTFAKNFLLAGGDIIALQRILGHSTMDMVRKYVQHTPEDLLASHDRYVMHLKQKHKKRL